MRKVYAIILLAVSLVAFAALTGFSSQASQSKAKTEIVNKIKINESTVTKNGSKNEFKYTLSLGEPIINLTSPQIESIDVDALKKEIGDKNVGVDYDNKQLHLNLKGNIDDKGTGSFMIETTSNQQMILSITDLAEEELLMTVLNPNSEDTSVESILKDQEAAEKPKDDVNSETEKTDDKNNQADVKNEEDSSRAKDDEDDEGDLVGDDSDDGVDEDPNIYEDEDNPNNGWTRTVRMMITPGHIENTGDTQKVPVIYFGAINYALQGITIRDAVAGRPLRKGVLGLLLTTPIGDGRKDNVTAANTSIIEVPKNSNMNAEQTNHPDRETNQYFTNTFGDGRLPPPKITSGGVVSAGDKVYRGSQRNFVTTNIFDYYKSSGDYTKPKLFGPDAKNSGKYVGLVKKQTRLYYKPYVDPETKQKTTMQRLIFYQKVGDYQIQVKITQRFDKNNKVIINQEFKNVGTKHMNNFTGYTFRDVTFMKNHDLDNSVQNNPLLSLGGHRGMYASSAKYGSRAEFYLDEFEDSPYAWAGRDSKSTFFEADKKDHFPWIINDKYNKLNSFTDINDVGDKAKEPGFGKDWLDGKKRDSSISLHTKNRSLGPGETVTMSYAVNAVALEQAPELGIYKKTTREKPDDLQPESPSYKVNGFWRTASAENVDVRYLVRPLADSADDAKDKQELLKSGKTVTDGFKSQTKTDQETGVPHKWSTEIKLDQLHTGINEVYAIAVDKKGRTSKIERTYVNLREREEERADIMILTPKLLSTKEDPYNVLDDDNYDGKINITGWSKSPSDKYNVKYYLDESEDGAIIEDVKHGGPNEFGYWKLDDFPVDMFITDNEVHKVTFKLVGKENDGNGDDNVEAVDVLWIRVGPDKPANGSLQLLVPKTIDFGAVNLTSNSEKDVKPSFKGDFFLDDYRESEKKSNPIRLSLKAGDFKEKNSPNSDNKLNTELLWSDEKVETSKHYDIQNELEISRIFLTDIVKDNLHLKIKRDQTTKDGSFGSRFSWEATDSI